jgi:hypothetical protein
MLTNGNVGINTTNSNYKLEVNGTLGVSRTDGIIFAGSGGSGQGNKITSDTSNNLIFSTSLPSAPYTTAEKVRILNNGNVGVGTTDPTYLLDVNEDDNVLAFRVTGGGGGAPMASFVRDVGTTGSSVNINAAGNFPQIQFANTGNTFSIGGDTAGNFKISDNTSIGTNDRITIDSSGNVGIGTTSPEGKLHIGGISDSVSGLVLEASGTGDNRVIDFQNTAGALRLGLEYDNANINLNLVDRNRNKLVTFREGGNVGIGVTAPGYQLQLSSNSAAKPSSSLWTVVSDSRVKENIRDYTTGLEAILKIEPKIYDYNGKAGFEKTKDNIGIIAQDMQDVMPETIKTYNTKLNEEDTEDTELLNFDGHAVTFALINAVKDLKAEIEELKKQINK